MGRNDPQWAIVTLGAEVPGFVGAALRRLPGAAVIEGAPETSIVRRGGADVLRLRILGVGDLVDSLRDTALLVDDHATLIAVEGVLDDRTAARLEDLGVSFADVEGRAWIAGGPRTVLARGRHADRHMRPESLRLAQLLADHPAQGWTQRALATRGESTQVTAQRLLRRLEDEGLVAREGAGRSTERTVTDGAAMRRWLLEHGRPGTVVRLPFFVRDATGLPDRVEDVNLALTGGAAAKRLGVPVTTAPPVPTFRADCGPERLEDVPSLLGGFRTDSGPTAVLIADPQRLAHIDARRLGDGTLVAPPSRVMLDLLLESRGAATAQLFADLWRDEP